ncbi:hypothetical protein [Caenimonas sedimenti]|nr:hypothetical protein [Caenimonas sedimenti]
MPHSKHLPVQRGLLVLFPAFERTPMKFRTIAIAAALAASGATFAQKEG